MYNEKQKEEYLRYIYNFQGAVNKLKGIFKKTAPYEEAKKKDISLFTEAELIELYQVIGYGPSTVYAYNKILRNYAVYFNPQNTNFNRLGKKEYGYLFESPKDNLKKEQDIATIVTYREIDEILNKLNNPLDQFIIYGLFCGIQGKGNVELTHSSMEDSNSQLGLIWLAAVSDKDTNIINKKGRSFYADERLFNYAKKASESLFYMKNEQNGLTQRQALEGDDMSIYKIAIGIELSEKIDNTRMRVIKKVEKIMRGCRDINAEKATALNIFYSGLVYAIRKAGLKDNIFIKGPKDISLLNEEDLKSIEHNFNISFNKKNLLDALRGYM